MLNKTMQVIGHKQSIYLISKNKKVRVWHYKFVYISNAKIIKTSKLFTGMRDFNKKYNST